VDESFGMKGDLLLKLLSGWLKLPECLADFGILGVVCAAPLAKFSIVLYYRKLFPLFSLQMIFDYSYLP
jgi:hypothetical protein